ncbi:cytochrome P450 [Mycena pura]|uniref:Cytochrome P450 n=1 Tax=Mycena pura TaxID=153505 RepID=A0AAD6YQY3_9AGAR|nr:cytochrome P450 [Mycena pura]
MSLANCHVVLILASLAAIILIAIPLYRLSPLHPLYSFPGPRLYKASELPMLYHAIRGTQHNVLKRLHDEYGSVVRIGPSSLTFKSLSAIRKIYGSSQALNKSSAYDFAPIEGDGIFKMQDKDTHTARRRIWNRAFTEHAISEYYAPLVLTTQRLIRTLLRGTREAGAVDLTEIFPRYTYDAINAIFFSGNAFEQASLLDSGDPEGIVAHGSAYFKAFGLGSHIRPVVAHIAKRIPGYSTLMKFEGFAERATRRRLENGPSFKDGISYLLDNEHGKPTVNVKDLPVESVVILLGGADSPSATCILLMYFLMTNPNWYGLLCAELDEFFREKYFNAQLHALDNCVVLNAVIQESLRLSSPFPPFPRVVPPTGIEINNHFVPGGTSVAVPVWTHHLDPEYFPQPNLFDPGRWIENSVFKGRDTLFTFSAGPFNCAGSRLAYVQLRIFTAMLVTQLKFTPTAPFDAGKFWDGMRSFRSTTFLEPLLVSVVSRGVHVHELEIS